MLTLSNCLGAVSPGMNKWLLLVSGHQPSIILKPWWTHMKRQRRPLETIVDHQCCGLFAMFAIIVGFGWLLLLVLVSYCHGWLRLYMVCIDWPTKVTTNYRCQTSINYWSLVIGCDFSNCQLMRINDLEMKRNNVIDWRINIKHIDEPVWTISLTIITLTISREPTINEL